MSRLSWKHLPVLFYFLAVHYCFWKPNDEWREGARPFLLVPNKENLLDVLFLKFLNFYSFARTFFYASI